METDMSVTNKVLEFIDEYYRNAVQRPRMYFSSPESFEDIVIVLERLLDMVINNESKHPSGTYPDFLESSGFGSASFTIRYKEGCEKESIDEDKFYKAYSEFLMEYLNSGREKSNQ